MAVHPAYRGRPVVAVRDLGTGNIFSVRLPPSGKRAPAARPAPRPVPIIRPEPPADAVSFERVASRRIQEITEPTPSYPLTSFDPYIFPPPTAIEIDRFVQGNAGIGDTVPSSLVFNMPVGHIGILRWFANFTPIIPGVNVNGPPPFGVYFTLRKNEAPVFPYSRVYLNLGQIDRPTEIFVRIPAESKVDVLIQNETGAVQTIAARFKGWYWPEGMIVNRKVLEAGGPIDDDGEDNL